MPAGTVHCRAQAGRDGGVDGACRRRPLPASVQRPGHASCSLGHSYGRRFGATLQVLSLVKECVAMASLDLYLPQLLQFEGGFVDDPSDPGGATNRGITLATFQRYAQPLLGEQPTLDALRALTPE